MEATRSSDWDRNALRSPDAQQAWDASFPNDAILPTPAERKVGKEDQAVLVAFGTFTAKCTAELINTFISLWLCCVS